MSEEKKKIRDVAQELKLQPKDVLAAAKELGILSAKAVTSTLSDVDANKLRNHFAPASDKPEVIVRRRKQAASTRTAPPSSAEHDSVEKDSAVIDQPEEATEKSVSEKKSVTFTARIVQRPGEQAPDAATEAAPAHQVDAVQESAAEKVETPQTPVAPEPVAAVPVIDEAKAPEDISEKSLQTEKEVEPPVVNATQVVAEESGESNSFATARVVRPATFSAEPDRDESGEAVSSAPVFAAKIDYAEDQSEPAEEVAPAASQVRVISRPSAAQNTAPRPRAAAPAGRGDEQAAGQRRPGGPRPSGPGGARPSGPGSPRPSGAGGSGRGPASEGGAPFAPVVESDQSRKKKNKGRRTVDFEGDSRFQREQDDSGWAGKASRKKGRGRSRDSVPASSTQPMKAGKRVIKVEEFIRVADLAHQMGLKAGEIVKVLFNLGVMATINQSLDVDTATLVASEFGYDVEKVGFSEEDIITAHHSADKEEDLVTRPPVVTIMGHVDHGKTSLLDAVRKASVVKGEAGGITQHIGAYHVTTPRGEIVFLDTPGHEAFTAMRARGAEVTDIVVLVVAADDGVMEQTREAVSHAKAANVPIMVAVNKMDKPEANPDRVKRELADIGLVPEEWGGDTTFSYVSAKTGQGLDELLDLLALQAEILELKANPNKAAIGYIVEAKLDKGRGALGTVLIQQGTLRLGDAFVCGIHSGRVRAMFNDQGKKVKEAGPSMPVEVQGFEGVPEAGEDFISLADEKAARRIAEARALKQRERELAKESKVTLETFLARKSSDVEAVTLNLVVKADVQGSLEAINDALRKMSTDSVRINLLHGGTGAISESDVLLASATNAIIIGFNVRPTAKAKELAETEKIDMRFYDIIYKLVEEIRSAMEGMLAPVSKEVFLGSAEVRETFSVPKVGMIAGSYIIEGKAQRNALARLLRDGVVVYTGKVSSLRRFKDDVREVAKGYECGIGLENFNDIKAGDVIELYEIVEEAAKLT